VSRYALRVITLLGFLALGLIAAPAAMAGDPCYHGFSIPPRTAAAEAEIKVAPCAFAPTVAYVAPGSTVTFFNGPDFTHLITGANQEWGSRDVELRPGERVSYRFANAGVYPYACALHRGMSGAIVVGRPDEPAGGRTVVGEPASADDYRGQSRDEAPTTGKSGRDPPSAPTPEALATVAGGAGVVVGAGGAWLAMRRRRTAANPVGAG
jgi:plastocyanin